MFQFNSLLTPEIGIAFTAIFISLLYFKRKLTRANADDAAQNDAQTPPNVAKRQDAKSAIIPNEFEPPKEANLEDETSRDENNLDLCAPIVKLRDFDVSPEELFGENVQESNISEILGQYQQPKSFDQEESKDEKKDSAFETSESEADSRDKPTASHSKTQHANEIISVSELQIEKAQFKSVAALSETPFIEEEMSRLKRDSGTISPAASDEIIASVTQIADKYENTVKNFSANHQKRSITKIDDKLKATLENMFNEEELLVEEDGPMKMRDEARRTNNNFVFEQPATPADCPPLIIDLGSMWSRMGFSTETNPDIVQRTMIGHLRKTLTNKEQTYYGQDVVSRSGILSRQEPLMGDNVNWEQVCDLLEHYMGNRYEVDFADQPVTLSTTFNRTIRKGAAQQIFEGRHSPAILFVSQSSCGLFGAGYTSGIVAHGGHTGIEVVPVYEGAQLHHARRYKAGGGQQIVENLRVFLRDECARPMNTFSEVEFLRQVCENHGSFYRPEYCPRPKSRKVEFELPDGNTVNFRDGIRHSTDNLLPSADTYEEVLSM